MTVCMTVNILHSACDANTVQQIKDSDTSCQAQGKVAYKNCADVPLSVSTMILQCFLLCRVLDCYFCRSFHELCLVYSLAKKSAYVNIVNRLVPSLPGVE